MSVTIFSAFIAGLLTFLAPCTLPLIPGFLAYITGATTDELRKGDSRVRRTSFFHGFAFVFGFSLVFIALGIFAGFLGARLFFIKEWLSRIGGVVIIFFGLYLLGLFNISFFEKTKRFDVSRTFHKGKYVSAFLFGISFGIGWTPCIGPILGSILLIASSSATVFSGGVLLSAFSLGLAIPFLIVSVASGFSLKYIQKYSKALKYFSITGGVFLIILGGFMLLNNFEYIIVYGYQLFDFINYDSLVNYL